MEGSNNKKTKRSSRFPGMLRGFAAPVTLAFFAVPLLLAAGLIAMGFWAADRHREAEALRMENEAIYRQAYAELTESVRELNADLSKLVLSEAPNTLALSLDGIWRESGAITALLGRIPQAHPENVALNRLIVQTGDYCRSLSASVLGGRPLTEKDRSQLLSLLEASGKIYTGLSDRLAGGNVPVSALSPEQFFAEPAETADYPSLDYKGPYSDAAEDRPALGVSGDEINEEEAGRKAGELISLALGDGSAAERITAESISRVEAGYPRYDLALSLPDGRKADIALTAQGGQLVYFRLYGSRETAQTAGTTFEDLIDKGLEFLGKIGYEHAEPTYHSNCDGSVVVSYCCTQGLGSALSEGEEEPSVIMMNDTVRLRFDTGNGDIIGADASSCLMNHTERSFTEVAAIEQAQANLSPYLSVSSSRLALIPTDDLSERLCWEFRGSFMGSEYLVYMDAATGDEVRIVRIISDESGTAEG